MWLAPMRLPGSSTARCLALLQKDRPRYFRAENTVTECTAYSQLAGFLIGINRAVRRSRLRNAVSVKLHIAQGKFLQMTHPGRCIEVLNPDNGRGRVPQMLQRDISKVHHCMRRTALPSWSLRRRADQAFASHCDR
jgi:hypothetical protein